MRNADRAGNLETVLRAEQFPGTSPGNAPSLKTCRSYSPAEELAHWISHAAGFAGMLAGAPFLILAAMPLGAAAVVGVSIFAVTGALLYLASALYHCLPAGKTKDVFELFDHSAIYLFIAGTYTPFTLGVLSGAMGWTLFGLIWAFAVTGVALTSVFGIHKPWISAVLYLVMGWLILIAVPQLVRDMPLAGLLWIVGGGVAYTAGVAFYLAKRMQFAHFVWHLFVLGGTACHFFAVLWYSA